MQLNRLEIPKGGINVLSLFDGMSCGQVALQRAGIPVKNYFAAEIDKHAMKVTQDNFPNTIFLGDVTKIHIRPDGIHVGEEFFDEMHVSSEKIDLLIGGSPCQGFSFAGKQLNFNDPRSKLFFEFVRLMDEAKPRFFFLENVKMKKEFENIITETLCVDPIEINSNLVSAQNRKRLYWTNIAGVKVPEDRGILMKDIVHEYNDELYNEDEFILKGKRAEYFARNAEYRLKKSYFSLDSEKAIPLMARGENAWNGNHRFVETKRLVILFPEATKKGFVEVGEGEGVDLTFIESKTRRGRLMVDKTNCLTAAKQDFCIVERLNEYIVPFDKTLRILDKEIQRGKVGFFRTDSQANRVYYIHDKAVTLTGESGGGAAKMGQYLFGCITPDRIEKRQNGQRFNDGRKFYTLTAQDQHGILIEGYIRKLTPVECERLQTLPDNYTVAASKAQRYKMLGNGWTVDVIVEFFKKLNIIQL